MAIEADRIDQLLDLRRSTASPSSRGVRRRAEQPRRRRERRRVLRVRGQQRRDQHLERISWLFFGDLFDRRQLQAGRSPCASARITRSTRRACGRRSPESVGARFSSRDRRQRRRAGEHRDHVAARRDRPSRSASRVVALPRCGHQQRRSRAPADPDARRLVLVDIEAPRRQSAARCSAQASAASSTTGPRDVLIRYADALHARERRSGRSDDASPASAARAARRRPTSSAARSSDSGSARPASVAASRARPAVRDAHAERRRASRRRPADAADADEPSCLPRRSVPSMKSSAQPFQPPRRTRRSPSTSRRVIAEDQRPGEVGDRLGQHVRRVRDDDAARARVRRRRCCCSRPRRWRRRAARAPRRAARRRSCRSTARRARPCRDARREDRRAESGPASIRDNRVGRDAARVERDRKADGGDEDSGLETTDMT